MSCVLVVAPLVVGSWPAITAAVTAAIGTMGFSLANQASDQRQRSEGKSRAEIEVENSEILEGTAGSGEELIVERDGIRAIFSRDPGGSLRVCMEGHGCSKSELKRLGEELIGRVTQQYAYHRIVTELKQRNMPIVNEEVAEDRTITIQVRNW